MKYIKIDIDKIRLYTSWDSSVSWGWGMISTIKIFKTGYNDKKTQAIHRWLYD
jgi:hypothetical protein